MWAYTEIEGEFPTFWKFSNFKQRRVQGHCNNIFFLPAKLDISVPSAAEHKNVVRSWAAEGEANDGSKAFLFAFFVDVRGNLPNYPAAGSINGAPF